MEMKILMIIMFIRLALTEYSGTSNIKDCVFHSRISYEKLVILQEPIETDLSCTYFNGSEYDNDTFIGDGRVYNIIFNEPSNLSFSIDQTYNDKNHSIPLLFKSTWSSYEGVANKSFLMHLFNDSVFKYVNFRTPKRQFRTENCSTHNDTFLIDNQWCRRHETYKEYTGLKPESNSDECLVFLRDIQAHYLYLWEKSSSHIGRERTCFDSFIRKFPYSKFLASKYLQDEFPQFFNCYKGKTQRQIDGNCNLYNLKFYSAIAEGSVREVQAYRRGNDFDIEMTIDLSSWSADYPQQFFKSVNSCLTEIGTDEIPAMLQIIILHPHEIPPPPPKTAPFHFWIFALIMLLPGCILAVAIVILVFTRSSRGLQIEVWSWPKLKRKLSQRDMLHTNEIYLEMRKNSTTQLIELDDIDGTSTQYSTICDSD